MDPHILGHSLVPVLCCCAPRLESQRWFPDLSPPRLLACGVGLKNVLSSLLFFTCVLETLLLTWGRGQFVRINLCVAVPLSLFPGSPGTPSSKLLLLSKHSGLLHRCQIKSSTISGAPARCHLKRCGNRSIKTVFCRTCSQKAFPGSVHTEQGREKTQEGLGTAVSLVR